MSASPLHATEILIVEDSATQALKLQYLLEKNGCKVVAAKNGREALAQVEKRQPTLVISDITMPEMDGYELCSTLRADARFAAIPLILLTALSDPRDIVRGLQVGANNFIVKPYGEKFLLARVHDLLANMELRRSASTDAGFEVFFDGQKHSLMADRLQMIDLLLSSYDTAVQKNRELQLITEQLEQKTRELERSNRELEQFGYVVSHDLQEPLRAIMGFLDLLQRRHHNNLEEKAVQYIELAVKGAGRMQALIQDLLSYGRLGAKPKRFLAVDCGQAVRDALANLGAAIAETGAEITVAPDLPTLQGDPIQLMQLLQNLVGNALKFRAENRLPRISITARRAADQSWEFAVADNGIGIEENDFGRIFQVFQRLHERGKYPGTGIGLAVCKKIVERHGGEIWVESCPGAGTTFHFTLPA